MRWRLWFEWALGIWRRSLQLRVVLLTVLLSSVAVIVVAGFIVSSVRTNLFDSRHEQIVTEARRATNNAQSIFSNVTDLSQPQALEVARANAQESILRSTSSPGGTMFAIVRAPGQPDPGLMQSVASTGFDEATMVSQALRAKLGADQGDTVYSQPIGIQSATGATSPGIITGSVLNVPSAGKYQLFLVFSLSDVQETLSFVEQVTALGGLALVVLIAAVVAVVLRLVVGPMRVAAATAERIAAGELDRRLPARGTDVIASLASSFNRMADSIQRQIRALAELSRMQQRFVSDVSHELRTPLTTMRLAGTVLYDDREHFDPADRRSVELLHEQLDRFELLLVDLLEMSRYDAGAVTLEFEPANVVRLVEDAITGLAPLAAERGSELRLNAPGGYCEAVIDARRVRRILQNLIGNAIDHGEGRAISVHVDSNEDAVSIAVRDFGIGMTPAQLDRVFDRFWRADPSRQRRTGGTGLGLAISLEDAVAHGGRLEAWSADGEGSCFRLTLPREQGVPISHPPLRLPPDEPEPEDAAASHPAASGETQ